MAIVNLGRLANQRFPWLNPDGPRRRHQIILREEGQDEANPDQADEESSEESENEDNGDNQNFDTQLPTQHSVSHQIILEQCTDKTSITPFRQGITIMITRKYPLRGYFLGVLTHTTAWDQLQGGDETLKCGFKIEYT